MRCISKPWKALLSQPSFIKSHLDRSIHSNNEILLIFYKGFSFDSKLFTTHLSRSPHIELTIFIKLPITDPILGDVIGSVNGLICFSIWWWDGYSFSIRVWSQNLWLQVVKLASISSIEDTCACVFDYWLQVEVYSMRKGSWKLITQRFLSHITRIFYEDQVCVDGHTMDMFIGLDMLMRKWTDKQ